MHCLNSLTGPYVKKIKKKWLNYSHLPEAKAQSCLHLSLKTSETEKQISPVKVRTKNDAKTN